AVAAREDVARPCNRGGEHGEDDGEDLRPSGADRQRQLLARAQEKRARHGSSLPNSSFASTAGQNVGVPSFAVAMTPELFGEAMFAQRKKLASRARIHADVL